MNEPRAQEKTLPGGFPSWVVAGRFEVTSVLCEQDDNVVYIGTDLRSGRPVAVKVESVRYMQQHYSKHHSMLFTESELTTSIRFHSEVCKRVPSETPKQLCVGFLGVPEFIFTSKYDEVNVAVMEILGPDLENLATNAPGGSLSAITVAKLAVQMLNRLKKLHEMGIVHRDLKPDNFVIGRGKDSSTVYLIDFGLAKRFVDENNRLTPVENSGQGNVMFASLSWHVRSTFSPADDLEALVYTLVYVHHANEYLTWMPWMRFAADHLIMTNKGFFAPVAEKLIVAERKSNKNAAIVDQLLLDLLTEARRIKGGTRVADFLPDYEFFRNKFRKFLLQRKAIDLPFQWESQG